MKRIALTLVTLPAVLALGACNGAITSVGIPAGSPWNNFGTAVMSPSDDITVVTVGNNISASIADRQRFAVCTSDQGKFFGVCDELECMPPAVGPEEECAFQAPPDATNVGFDGQLVTGYAIDVTIDRPAFTAGGVQIQSVSAGTVGAIALSVDGAATLNIGAGFSEGLIQGATVDSAQFTVPTELADDFSGLVLNPDWPDFGNGYVCTDGTTTSCDPDVSFEGVAALCNAEPDTIAFRTNQLIGPISVLCGSVTVNINVNAPYASAGECITSLKQQRCGGLTGQAKAACNHAQIGVCNATFNVPSAHNPS